MDTPKSSNWKIFAALFLVVAVGISVYSFGSGEGMQGLLKIKKNNTTLNQEAVKQAKVPPTSNVNAPVANYFTGECLGAGNTSSTLVFDGVAGAVGEYHNTTDFLNALKAELRANGSNQTKCPYLFKIYRENGSANEYFSVVANNSGNYSESDDGSVFFTNGSDPNGLPEIYLSTEGLAFTYIDRRGESVGGTLGYNRDETNFQVYRVAPDYVIQY